MGSITPKRLTRIDPHGAHGRDETRDECRREEDERSDNDRDWIVRPDAEQEGLQRSRQPKCAEQPDGDADERETRALPHYELEDSSRRRAERGPKTDLARALRDVAREH